MELITTITYNGIEIEIFAEAVVGGVKFTIDSTGLDQNYDINGLFIDLGNNGGAFTYFGSKADNLNGADSGDGTKFDGWDAGAALGSIGGNDTNFTDGTVTISGLTLAQLDGAEIGLRLTSVADPTSGGSLKLAEIAELPPPNVSYDGLTLGYWMNHTESWDGHNTGDSFETLFGINVAHWDQPPPGDQSGTSDWYTDDITLLQALGGGGGLPGGVAGANLARQATAAVLNADSDAVNIVAGDDTDLLHPYRFTAAEIEHAVQFAFGLGANTHTDNVYDPTPGDHLALVLEFWNHAQDAETTADPTPSNTSDDDVESLLVAGVNTPNMNTDADSDPGLTGTGLMYTGTLIQVLQDLYSTDLWA